MVRALRLAPKLIGRYHGKTPRIPQQVILSSALELLFDSGEARDNHCGESEIGIGIGSGHAVLDAKP